MVGEVLFLGIDVIGARLRRTVVAGLAGLAYALVTCALVDLFADLMRHLPMATTQTHLLWAPLVDSVPLIPGVAASQQSSRAGRHARAKLESGMGEEVGQSIAWRGLAIGRCRGTRLQAMSAAVRRGRPSRW
jgi:hypothetical protein